MFYKRLFSSVVLVTLLLGALLWESSNSMIIFGVLAILLAFFALKEFAEMLEKIELPMYKNMTAQLGVLIMLSVIFESVYDIPIVLLLSLFAGCSWIILTLVNSKKIALQSILNSAAALVLLILPLSLLVSIYFLRPDMDKNIGRKLLLFLILVTKSGDIGAYVIGTLSGKFLPGDNHKIVPTISPKKSWEGTIGGMFVSLGTAFLINHYFHLFPTVQLVILGIVLFWGGFIGDLSESALKRTCGVKDSGATLPGIGGIMDLLDSLIINAPLFYLFIKIISEGGV